MNAQVILSEIQSLGGRLEVRGERLHVDVPAGTLPPQLKARLRENKVEILRELERKVELEASMKRLEALEVCVAIWEDGSMRIVDRGAVSQAWKDGDIVYEPKEMLTYIRLRAAERKLFRDLKAM